MDPPRGLDAELARAYWERKPDERYVYVAGERRPMPVALAARRERAHRRRLAAARGEIECDSVRALRGLGFAARPDATGKGTIFTPPVARRRSAPAPSVAPTPSRAQGRAPRQAANSRRRGSRRVSTGGADRGDPDGESDDGPLAPSPNGARPARCRYHCHACSGHFASLAAFDAHREGAFDGERRCSYPDDADLREREGECHVAGAAPIRGITVYELAARADRARSLRRDGRFEQAPNALTPSQPSPVPETRRRRSGRESAPRRLKWRAA